MRSLSLLCAALTIASSALAMQQASTSQVTVSASATPSPSFRIVIAPHVFDELDALADTLGVETARCLIGVVTDSALIDLAWQPPIASSSPTGVRYQSCPGATIALWHNHRWTSEPGPEYACYLSRTDIQEALRPHAPPVQIVQVNSEVACWWTRRQVARAATASILWAVPHQRRGAQVSLAEACATKENEPEPSGTRAWDDACRTIVAADMP